jgi:gas vesicle protein
MARSAFALLQARINPPATPKPPKIVGVGEMPPDRSFASHSAPYRVGNLVVVRTVYWKRIHFCNVNCGSPCKVTWRYKRGISIADLNEISSKIGAQLQGIGLPGVSAEIGSKISSTITHSNEEETSREFTRTAPTNGGVTHAHWQLMEQYTLSWSVKKLFRKARTETDVIEGGTDAFDETHLFYIRPDCSESEDRETLLDKLKRGFQPLIAQGAKTGVLIQGKPAADGSFSLDGFSGTYKLEGEIPGNLMKRYLRLSPSDLHLLNGPLYLQPYSASLELLLGIVKRRQPSHQDRQWLAFSVGSAVGTLLGFLFAPRSGKETRALVSNTVQEGRDYFTRHKAETRQHVSQWVDRGKEVLKARSKQVECLEEGREASQKAMSEEKETSS